MARARVTPEIYVDIKRTVRGWEALVSSSVIGGTTRILGRTPDLAEEASEGRVKQLDMAISRLKGINPIVVVTRYNEDGTQVMDIPMTEEQIDELIAMEEALGKAEESLVAKDEPDDLTEVIAAARSNNPFVVGDIVIVKDSPEATPVEIQDIDGENIYVHWNVKEGPQWVHYSHWELYKSPEPAAPVNDPVDEDLVEEDPVGGDEIEALAGIEVPLVDLVAEAAIRDIELVSAEVSTDPKEIKLVINNNTSADISVTRKLDSKESSKKLSPGVNKLTYKYKDSNSFFQIMDGPDTIYMTGLGESEEE